MVLQCWLDTQISIKSTPVILLLNFFPVNIGEGLFTEKPIAMNIFVCEYFGKIETRLCSNYSLYLPKQNIFINAEHSTSCLARFANCSQNSPNLKMVHEQGRQFLYSIRHICRHEELVWSYVHTSETLPWKETFIVN